MARSAFPYDEARVFFVDGGIEVPPWATAIEPLQNCRPQGLGLRAQFTDGARPPFSNDRDLPTRRPVAGLGQTPIGHSLTQFTSSAFTRRAIDSGLLPSMASVGHCFDRAVIESFWSRM